MARFTIKDGEQVRTRLMPIETATAIEAGDLVTIASGYIIKAVAASTAVAFAPKAHPANSGTSIEITVGNDFTLIGTADANYAATDFGNLCGIDDTTQAIDLGDSSSELRIVGGTVGSTANVEVKIYAPII
jgi:hypothetical protein